MMVLVDNDILLKGASYRLLSQPLTSECHLIRVGYLGAARFVLSKRIRRTPLHGDAADVEAELLSFLDKNKAIETTAEEQTLAATLESMAQSIPVNLDTGESQLLAVLALRMLPTMMTGDKRAIIAIERLLDVTTALSTVLGKVTCLEQVVRYAVTSGSASGIQEAICREPEVDRALSICFSCFSPERTSDTIVEALDSYISSLRREAPRVLST